MASAEIPEGVYRLLGQHGCLSGGSPDAPLNLLPHGEHGHQLWEVKKHQNDQYTITSKDKPEMGITHPKEVQHMELVKLGSPPRAFKIQPMPDGPMPNMFK
ncbi:conserved hypothetical protein [Sporisorium reilianum SRZ2]|uniref:Ricin B lectin domain-containing protein n=1 Tax=Sporisorium reilianum (strain SRZ2) TaxID=999809 RepID=E6ZVW1_SPORE|nr:conserved hypothetical protein [Sporisorium reilianum SRZ2]